MSLEIEFSENDRRVIPFAALLRKADDGYENEAIVLAYWLETHTTGDDESIMIGVLNSVAAAEHATATEIALAIRVTWELRHKAEAYFAAEEKRLGGKLI